jgi:hypothetical protein
MARRNRVLSFLLGMTIAAALTLGVIWGDQPVNTAGFAWGTNAHANVIQADQAQSSVIWGTRS